MVPLSKRVSMWCLTMARSPKHRAVTVKLLRSLCIALHFMRFTE